MKNKTLLIFFTVCLIFILGCTKTTKKEQIITEYRQKYGNNWDNWTPEVKEQFKNEIISSK